MTPVDNINGTATMLVRISKEKSYNLKLSQREQIRLKYKTGHDIAHHFHAIELFYDEDDPTVAIGGACVRYYPSGAVLSSNVLFEYINPDVNELLRKRGCLGRVRFSCEL